jgi:hypothetical protein
VEANKSWKQPLAEMQGNVAYIRPKVVRPFLGLRASGSYVHRAALFSPIFAFFLWLSVLFPFLLFSAWFFIALHFPPFFFALVLSLFFGSCGFISSVPQLAWD